MALKEDKIQLRVLLNMEQAQKDLAKTVSSIEGLKSKMSDLKKAGKENSDEFKSFAEQLDRANQNLSKQQAIVKERSQGVSETFKLEELQIKAVAMSMRELENVRRRLVAQSKGTRADSDEYKQLAEAVANVNTVIKQRKAEEDEVARAMQRQNTIWK
jgi:peptidoglycan hydrolase CwlO-like protein